MAHSKQKPAEEQLWSPVFVLIMATTFLAFVCGQGTNAGTSVFISAQGGSATFSGILAAVFSVAAGLARFICGPGIDGLGRRVMMLAGSIVLLAGSLLPIFAYSKAIMIASRTLMGFGFSVATTAAATAAPDVLPFSRLGEGIGYNGLGSALAMSIGPAAAVYLAGMSNPAALYIGASVVTAVCIVLAFCIRYEKRPEILPETSAYRKRLAAKDLSERTSEPTAEATSPSNQPGKAAKGPLLQRLFDPSALPGTLPMLFLSTNNGFVIFFCALYGATIGIGNAGLFFTLAAISMIVVRISSKKFMDRSAPLLLMGVTMVTGLIGDGLLLAAPAATSLFFVAGVFYGISYGLGIPLCQSVAVKNTPPDRWGAANALYMLSMDIGIGFSSILWGYLNDTIGFSVSLVCVMVCLVIAMVVAWFSFPGHGLKPMVAKESA